MAFLYTVCDAEIQSDCIDKPFAFSMIDELLGDPELPRYEDLSDGKDLDNLNIDRSLTRTEGWRTFRVAGCGMSDADGGEVLPRLVE